VRLFAPVFVLTLAAAAQEPQNASAPAFDLAAAATKATSAGKILMLRFEPSGEASVAELDKVIKADAALAASFGHTFQVESLTLLSKAGNELNQKFNVTRGVWPGVALIDRSGALMSIVDPATWKTGNQWDPARLRAFVAFWAPQGKAEPPKNNRLKDVREKYGPIYNPEADAAADIAAAVQKAKAEGKHVLVKIGGNWCPWCYFLHDELETRPELHKLVEENYVAVQVNWDQQHQNQKVMAQFGNPSRFGFPVLVVLDGEGRQLHTQDSNLLESGDHHDPKKVEVFLKGWTPKALKKT
jgi:thioredoxin-related protein